MSGWMGLEFRKIETIPEFIDAVRIRVDVFIKEQGFPAGWEPDEDDKKSVHFIAVANKEIVATVRYREPKKGEFKIERIATKKEFRGKGISSRLLGVAISDAGKKNPKRILATSQLRSKEFWEKNGFRAVSEPYDLYGQKHLDMELKN